jgi:hypothetical protein
MLDPRLVKISIELPSWSHTDKKKGIVLSRYALQTHLFGCLSKHGSSNRTRERTSKVSIPELGIAYKYFKVDISFHLL